MGSIGVGGMIPTGANLLYKRTNFKRRYKPRVAINIIRLLEMVANFAKKYLSAMC